MSAMSSAETLTEYCGPIPVCHVPATGGCEWHKYHAEGGLGVCMGAVAEGESAKDHGHVREWLVAFGCSLSVTPHLIVPRDLSFSP
jgi:hypothetical protein